MRVQIAIVTLLAAMLQPAHAEISADELLKALNSREPMARRILVVNISGHLNAYSWANTFLLVRRKQTQLFCTPDSLTLTEEQAIDILRNVIKKDAEVGQRPYGLALLQALQDTFPCK